MAEQTNELPALVPLNDWVNAPLLSDLQADLRAAKPIHDAQVIKINGWLDNLNVTGAAKVNTPTGSSKIVPRLIRKQAEWRYAALSEPFLSVPVLFTAAPVSWEDKKAAQQNALVLNSQFNTKIDKVKFIDEYVRTAVDEGTVTVKVCWIFEEEQYEYAAPIVALTPDETLIELFQELQQLQETDPNGFMRDVPEELQIALDYSLQTGVPHRPTVTGTKNETRTRIVANKPSLEVCDYRNLVIDPSCKGVLADAAFIIYSFESTMSALRKDKRYKNLDHINVSSASALAEPDYATDTPSDFSVHDQTRKKIVVHEYWGYRDYNDTGIAEPFVCSWVSNTTIRQEKNPFPDKKHPFVTAQYLPVRRKTHGEPDGLLIEDNQRVAGAVTRGMIDLMAKSANSQTGTRKDALDLTNRRKFERGMDYEFNPSVNPDTAFYTHKFPEIPASAQFMLQLQNMEAESLTGVKSFSGGISGAGLGDVAVGVRGALDAASKRELGILRRLAAGIVEIGKKIIAMNGEYLGEEEVIRITNEEFVKVRKDELVGEFDLTLTITTAEEDNAKAEELSFMLQTLGPNADPEMTRMIMADIARLRKMPDLAKKLEEFQPTPDPMQEQIQQLTIQKLQAEVAEINARAMSLQAGAQLDQAKVGTEGAKARQLSSNADKTDLDFVEQESGVTQERELQQHGAQAAANIELKREDHKLKMQSDNRTQLKAFLKNPR